MIVKGFVKIILRICKWYEIESNKSMESFQLTKIIPKVSKISVVKNWVNSPGTIVHSVDNSLFIIEKSTFRKTQSERF